MIAYLDCNATTPLDPTVREVVLHYLEVEFGNAGSRTHEYGARARRAVQAAREQVASVVDAAPDEVVFTSGATESNNIALLGLAAYGEASGKKHIVTSAIEHKAVLEPCEELERRGFEVSYVAPDPAGGVAAQNVLAAVRPDTLVVSLMQVNNETGVIQPIAEVASGLHGSATIFHVDAAQGFGKELGPLRSPDIHLISVSGHKIFGPKGIGALIVRKRGASRIPLKPLAFGGGQERGLRPGTLPVALVAGLGEAARQAQLEHERRREACLVIRQRLWGAFEPLGAELNGSWDHLIASAANVSFPGIDSEAVMLVTKDLAAFSNGSACTSSNYKRSHVLEAMGLPSERIDGACRFSWSHLSAEPDWRVLAERIALLT